MTFSEAVAKLGFYLASEVFRRASAYDTIPFSEWLKVQQAAFAPERKERWLLLPFDGEQGKRYELEAAREVLKQLQAKARTFEDHQAVLRYVQSMGFSPYHQDPDPWPVEVLKLCELAATFDQCVIAYGYVKEKHYHTSPLNAKHDFSGKYEVQHAVILERAANHAKTLAEWKWVANQHGTWDSEPQWRHAVEKMEPLASSLEDWLEFAKVVVSAGRCGEAYAERATQKIFELTMGTVTV
jgi:hypothetical protein